MLQKTWLIENVLPYLYVLTVRRLAGCCAHIRQCVVDDENRLLAVEARIAGDRALGHGVIRFVSPGILQSVHVEELGTNISHSDFQHVFALLKKSTLQELRIIIRNAHLLGDITIQGLAAVLPERLQRLVLYFGDVPENHEPSSAISNYGLKVLTAALPKGLQLLTLCFRACRLTSLKTLVEVLPTLTNLTDLTLDFCDNGDLILDALSLGPAMTGLRNMTYLNIDFSYTAVDPDELHLLITGLPDSLEYVDFDLGGTFLFHDNGEAISEVLSSLPASVRNLCLALNQMVESFSTMPDQHGVVRAVMSSLPTQIESFSLDIGVNDAQDWDAEDIVYAISDMLQRKSSLTHLDLNMEALSKISDAHIETISNLLRSRDVSFELCTVGCSTARSRYSYQMSYSYGTLQIE